MIEAFFAYDDSNRNVVAIGRVGETNVRYIIYLNGKIVMWSDEYD